jgi:hypothetical protein
MIKNSCSNFVQFWCQYKQLIVCHKYHFKVQPNLLNTELNPICHLLALLGAHCILHVSRIKIKG